MSKLHLVLVGAARWINTGMKDPIVRGQSFTVSERFGANLMEETYRNDKGVEMPMFILKEEYDTMMAARQRAARAAYERKMKKEFGLSVSSQDSEERDIEEEISAEDEVLTDADKAIEVDPPKDAAKPVKRRTKAATSAPKRTRKKAE